MRLRDGAINLEDYNIWKTRDVMGPGNCDGDILSRPGGFFWLCEENANAREMHGRKICHLSINNGRPISQYESMRVIESAEILKPFAFRGSPGWNVPCVGVSRNAHM